MPIWYCRTSPALVLAAWVLSWASPPTSEPRASHAPRRKSCCKQKILLNNTTLLSKGKLRNKSFRKEVHVHKMCSYFILRPTLKWLTFTANVYKIVKSNQDITIPTERKLNSKRIGIITWTINGEVKPTILHAHSSLRR